MRSSACLIAALGGLIATGGSCAVPPAAKAEQVTPTNLSCDAISYRGQLDPATMKELEPIHDLNKVAGVLTRKGVVFDRGRGVVTIALPPSAKAAIDALPPGEPIVLPSPQGGVVCVLVPSADSV
jgi:hypothetical protein